ncbi:hypothetical protein M3175_20995 [Robertmurraya korlensis]|uniref:hypothetical protein n=1 Tax=Robertmurraya korlensis TaxID=519977 RepID=UPI00203C608B|nr:hypothetical protein [Robertmurraya korlensis]MCM3603219.1 hypothetical protein [Robertmurraya korlensis]
MIFLKPEKRIPHNYFNEKVYNWVLQNQDEEKAFYEVHGSQGCCSCEIRSVYRNGKLDGFYRIDSEGNENYYFDYTWYIESEYLIEQIPNLTADEIEELEDMEQVWIHYCPECHEWAMDGANI